MSQSTKEIRHFSAIFDNFRQHSAQIDNFRQSSATKKRYNGMSQKKTRKPAKASAEAGFFVLGKENLMTIEYMARAASRHDTAFRMRCFTQSPFTEPMEVASHGLLPSVRL